MNTTTCPGGAALKPSQRLLDAGLTHYTCSVCGAPCDEHTSSGGLHTNDSPNENKETSMNALTLNDKTYNLSDELADRIKAELEAQEEQKAKPKRWRAEQGDRYYISDSGGEVYWSRESSDNFDDYRYSIGNYFETKQEALAYKKRLIAEQVIRDSSDFVPDWSDGKQSKYFIRYGYNVNEPLWVDYNYEVQFQTLAFYYTAKEAQAAIDNPTVRAAYLTVFGVKES